MSDHQSKKEKDRAMVYQLDGRPGLTTAVPLGLQHVLAMFTSNLAPILIIASRIRLRLHRRTGSGFRFRCSLS